MLIGAHKDIALALGDGLGEALGETLFAQAGEATKIPHIPSRVAILLAIRSPPNRSLNGGKSKLAVGVRVNRVFLNTENVSVSKVIVVDIRNMSCP